MLEDSPHKKVYEIHKAYSKTLLEELMQYEPIDIAVEDEDIGTVVERIYKEDGRDDS